MSFAGLPSTQELFWLLFWIIDVPMIIGFIYWFLRKQGWDPGPITRRAELEENDAKRRVLDDLDHRRALEKAGARPTRVEERFFWGLFSGLRDIDEVEDKEELGGA